MCIPKQNLQPPQHIQTTKGIAGLEMITVSVLHSFVHTHAKNIDFFFTSAFSLNLLNDKLEAA